MAIHATNLRVEVGPVPAQRRKGVIYFRSFEEMSKVLTPSRVELLEAIRRAQPESIYELAQTVKRDQGNVTKDVRLLERHGFVEIIRTKDGGRNKSAPRMEKEAIEMVIKLGAGAFGIAKETFEEVSGEFKGKKLEENTQYVRKKGKDAVEPVKKAVKDAVKRVADEFDIVTKK
jgi:predicted transcriptional regulator